VGLYKLNPGDPYSLKPAWFQPLSLSSEKPVSSLCFFYMQLVPLRDGTVRLWSTHPGNPLQRKAMVGTAYLTDCAHLPTVGRYNLNAVDP
jgi:hypothetical protein